MKSNTLDYAKKVRTLSKQLNEPEWFLANRLTALEKMAGLPKPQIERLDYLDWDLWQTPTHTNQGILIDESREDGVRILDFKTAFEKNEVLFKNVYAKSNFMNMTDFFTAHTLAFLTNGVFVYIPDNLTLKHPIELSFTQDTEKDRINNQQVLIYVGKNSSVEISEQYNSRGAEKSSFNLHIDFIVEEGAQVQYSSLDQLEQETTAFIRRTGSPNKDAKINIALGAMNAGNVVEDIHMDLKGQGSSSDVKTVAISHGQQVQMINVGVLNIGAHTVGNIFQHGVALERSTLSFNGIGHILKGAKYSDAQQESRILMLSDEARADANPILLIDEFEVQAGHAASVSKVDENQLYYLMSRGLDEITAEKMVIHGFLGIVLEEISIEAVRQALSEMIERKLLYYDN